ncbi:hypothetical protein Bca4012_100680 [Brassica carinata]
MKKSLQLSFTFLIIFIILSQGMMAEGQKKNCPQIPIKGNYCIPTECLAMCKKQHGTLGSCAEKGICSCACK